MNWAVRVWFRAVRRTQVEVQRNGTMCRVALRVARADGGHMSGSVATPGLFSALRLADRLAVALRTLGLQTLPSAIRALREAGYDVDCTRDPGR